MEMHLKLGPDGTLSLPGGTARVDGKRKVIYGRSSAVGAFDGSAGAERRALAASRIICSALP